MTALLLLQILGFALTGTRLQLWACTAAVLATLTFPVLVFGAPLYEWDWRTLLLWTGISLVVAPVVQRMVERLDEERRLVHTANTRVERLFDDAPHGVALLNSKGRILRANTALAALVGVTPDDMVRHPFTAYQPPENDEIADHLERLVHEPDAIAISECTLRDATGNDVDVALSSRILPDESLGNIVMVNVLDISEQRRYQDRLAHLVDHDVLTGLANRRLFDLELQRHLERCRRYEPTGAVLLLDLDNFKQVNDSLGHNAGDELLVNIGSVLRRAVRSTDVVARLGGDEFGVIVTDGDQPAAAVVAQNIVDRIREHAATLDGVSRRVTASVGAVTFKAASDHSVDILALADMTMYDAKEAGRNQVALLPEGEARPPKMSARLQWQDRIEAALEDDRFELLLQPVMDMRSGRVGMAEALLRLRGENGELVPPARFLYIAERAGLMPQVDAWVIERSIAILAEVRHEVPDFCLEVNLSGHSIGDEAVERAIHQALSQHQVDPHALILEITETAAVADVALARDFAMRLAEVGCRFALDDFGAGFGSFYYLKHLIFDYVKIDGEFVANVHTSQVDRTILRSIVGIARDLGKQTVAEFVSAPEILEVIREEGVDYAQGYLIGKPIPLADFRQEFLLTDAPRILEG
ncbi:putative bifunctional diguanylate cyclase/phosphodiesterase [Nocardioides piscis]|uniref:EAL domain-containing protein n=1 Tax=Nocardioides piscis TaxID=2714938 RepID=A0A6G7YDE1_9ACTN|nr:EAL domain-containing protein [Nocardioides piscis]QIK74696.1 EAL domain-containing protein [Nocardioides piscis]